MKAKIKKKSRLAPTPGPVAQHLFPPSAVPYTPPDLSDDVAKSRQLMLFDTYADRLGYDLSIVRAYGSVQETAAVIQLLGTLNTFLAAACVNRLKAAYPPLKESS